MGRGETKVSDSEGARTKEKKVKVRDLGRKNVKGRKKKWESLLWEREGVKKLYFSQLQMNMIFIKDATHEKEIVF